MKPPLHNLYRMKTHHCAASGSKRFEAVLIAVLALIFVTQTTYAAEPTVSSAPVVNSLLLADFEDTTELKIVGGLLDGEVKQSGQASVCFGSERKSWFFEFSGFEKDWSSYTDLVFSVYSSVDNAQQVALKATSQADFGNITNAEDYYFSRTDIVCDFTGWKEFRIPLKKLKKVRNPVGFHSIDGIMLCVTGWDIDTLPDTKLYVDDFRLE